MESETDGRVATSSLIERCRSGDNKAYRDLYDLYVKAMLNISYRIVNDRDEAEDLFQETFIKAVQQIERFDSEAALGGWLKRVIINASIDAVKKRQPHLGSVREAERLASEEEEEAGDEEVEYDIGTVRQCMAALPDGYRVILTLYLFEDYRHKEIAATLNISEGTSKSQYNRAKKKLVQLIKERQGIK